MAFELLHPAGSLLVVGSVMWLIERMGGLLDSSDGVAAVSVFDDMMGVNVMHVVVGVNVVDVVVGVNVVDVAVDVVVNVTVCNSVMNILVGVVVDRGVMDGNSLRRGCSRCGSGSRSSSGLNGDSCSDSSALCSRGRCDGSGSRSGGRLFLFLLLGVLVELLLPVILMLSIVMIEVSFVLILNGVMMAQPGDFVVVRVLDIVIRILIRVMIVIEMLMSVLVMIVESVSGVVVSVPVLLLFIVAMARVMFTNDFVMLLSLWVLIMKELLVAHQVLGSLYVMDDWLVVDTFVMDGGFVDDLVMDGHVMSLFKGVLLVRVTVTLVAGMTFVVDGFVTTGNTILVRVILLFRIAGHVIFMLFLLIVLGVVTVLGLLVVDWLMASLSMFQMTKFISFVMGFMLVVRVRMRVVRMVDRVEVVDFPIV